MSALSGGSRQVVAGVVGAVGGLLAGKYFNNADITYQEPPGVSKSLISPTTRAGKILAFGLPRAPTPGPMVYTNHVLDYDSARKVPRWVAEHLTKENVESNVANRKGVNFSRDPSVPSMFSSDNRDYWGSGWSRGHMAPAGNNKHCQQSMKDTFYLTNIVPQDLDNNGGYWNRLEIWCRELTKTYDDVWVISGPLWLPSENDNIDDVGAAGDEKFKKKKAEVKTVNYKVLGTNYVAVPTHLYKIVLVTDHKLQQPLLGTFIVPNVPIADKHLAQFRASLEDLERHVGVVFHPDLDRAGVGDLCSESGCNLQDYKQFMDFFWSRKLKNPWNLYNLEKDWQEIVNKGQRTDELEKLYNEAKKSLLEKEKMKNQSQEQSPVVVGA